MPKHQGHNSDHWFTVASLVSKARTQGGNSGQEPGGSNSSRPWSIPADRLALHGLLGLLSCSSQDHQSWSGTTHSELVPCTIIINQENAPQAGPQVSLMRTFLQSKFPLPKQLWLLYKSRQHRPSVFFHPLSLHKCMLIGSHITQMASPSTHSSGDSHTYHTAISVPEVITLHINGCNGFSPLRCMTSCPNSFTFVKIL